MTRDASLHLLTTHKFDENTVAVCGKPFPARERLHGKWTASERDFKSPLTYAIDTQRCLKCDEIRKK